MTIRRAVTTIAGFEAVAVAVWLIPASVHIVQWNAGAPHRIGLFASRSSLAALVIGGLAAAALLIFRGVRVRAWLSLLWLWAIPFLPWLPDRVPLLLLLAGPLRWVVAGVAIAGATRYGSRLKRKGDGGIFLWLRLKKYPRPLNRRLVFVASLALYLALGALHARAIGPGGDEPHYLVITHSLLVDHDLLIENNHTRRDYRAFFGGPLRPDYMRRGANGEIYSIHAPGLPVLMLPAYAVAGYPGVVVMFCVIAALTALAIFDLAAALAGPRVALLTWAAVALTVPFVPHSWLIFPELPGALIVAWAALWVWEPADRSIGAWAWRGAALATLPWLHTKFVIFLAVFGAALLARIWRRPRAALAMAIPIAVSLAAWFGYFYAIYGTFNPEAPYGAYTAVNVVARNIPRGLLGLMIDQKFGLLVYSPIYAFAIAGCWLMLRLLRRSGAAAKAEWRWLGAVLLAAVALHVGSTTRLYMWWGGNSAPARFLVPILPCLAPMIAVAAREIHARAGRVLLWTAFAASLTIAVSGVVSPRRLLLFSDPRGKARLVELIQGPAPLTSVLPTFTQEDWRSPVTNFLAMRIGPDEHAEVARRGAADLLWRYDAQKLRALDFSHLRKLDQTAVLEASILVTDRPRSAAGQRMIAGPLTLPPGSYEARIWFADARRREGEFVVSSSDRAVFARLGSEMHSVQNPAILPFQLPVGVGRLTVTASTPALADAAIKVEVAPSAVIPPHERESVDVRTIESLPQHPGAYIVYLNEHAYPEGGVFWTRGTGAASIAVAAPAARRLTLTLDSGPRDNDVVIVVAGSTRTVRTTAGAATDLTFDVPDGLRLIPITIQASSFFRPAEIDPSSADSRGLGCYVRIRLD